MTVHSTFLKELKYSFVLTETVVSRSDIFKTRDSDGDKSPFPRTQSLLMNAGESSPCSAIYGSSRCDGSPVVPATQAEAGGL